LLLAPNGIEYVRPGRESSWPKDKSKDLLVDARTPV